MNKSISSRFRLLLQICMCMTMLLSGLAASAQESEEFVVLHSESPGTLVLTQESLTAPFLKVTGDIDARDIQTLKTVTINVTHILDLSEAVIHEYVGTGGTQAPGTQPDWMIGDGNGPVTYPADYFPINAFLETRDNSLSKYYKGSYSLSRLILPKTLKGFMRDALSGNKMLTDIFVPEGANFMCSKNGLVLSADGTNLLQIPSACYGDIVVPENVTHVEAGVFSIVSPASVTFLSGSVPTLAEGNEISAAYIVAPQPEAYAQAFPDVSDIVKSIDMIEVNCDSPSQLLTNIGNMGYTRTDVRAVKITGTIDYDDLTQLLDLPNLHIADLSGAVCSSSDGRLYISNTSLTSLTLPTVDGYMSVEIPESSRLFGDLVVPEGVWLFSSRSCRFTSVDFPSTLQSVGSRLFYEGSVVERLDFSKCRLLETIEGMSFAGRLSEVKLPENIKKIDGFGGPIRNINLPSSLEYIWSPGGWLVEQMTLPESLTYFCINQLPCVKNIDSSLANKLFEFSGLHCSPYLESLDLSMAPIVRFNCFTADGENYSDSSIVASGGTRYPAPCVTAVKEVRLPSTIVYVNGFKNCQSLENLDMMGCFRLSEIRGICNNPSLRSISLPESCPTIKGFDKMSALEDVKSASSKAPQINTYYNEELDFSNVKLKVPKGCEGAYRMAEDWEKCQTIDASGYIVSFDETSLKELYDKPEYALLEGAGLYASGTTAILYAPSVSGKEFSGWNINGTYFSSNPLELEVSENISASPVVKVDSDNCDIVFDVDAPIPQTLTLSLWGKGNKNVILDGQPVSGTSSDYNTTNFDMELTSGSHTVMIAVSSENGLSFKVADESSLGEDILSVTSLRVNSPEALSTISPSYFRMDELDVSGSKKLQRISCFETNNIGIIKASDCPNLKNVSCWRAGVHGIDIDNSGVENLIVYGNSFEELAIRNHKSLKTIDISDNQLRSLDLRGSDCLETIDAEDNRLTEFSMTSPVCTSLLLGFNPMAFSTLTPLMYDIYMKMWKDMEDPSDAYQIIFQPDKGDLNATGLLDLSSEMYTLGSDVRNQVEINGVIVESENGIFSLPYGFYTINLTNAAYPGLVYTAYVESLYVKPAAPSGCINEVDGIVYYFWSDNPAEGEGNRACVMKVDDFYLGKGVPQYSGIVQIPPTVEYEGFKYTVTEIMGDAFADCLDLEGIGIPPTINCIGSSAFIHDENLKGVYITDLEAWMNIEFSNSSWCNPLEYAGNLYLNGEPVTEVVVPEGTTEIKRWVFAGCNSIEKVTLPQSMTSIGSNSFYKCENLSDINLPYGITSIDHGAFSNCHSIEYIDLPESLTELGSYAFSGCVSLKKIEIPGGLSILGNDMFWGCDNLREVKLNEGVENIDYRAFGNCLELEKVEFPKSLKKISANAFYDCVSLDNPMLPENIDTIANLAFYGADVWKVISLPESLKVLGEGAFSCRKLKALSVLSSVVPGHIGDNSPFMLADYDEVISAFKTSALPVFSEADFYKWFINDKYRIDVSAPEGMQFGFTSPDVDDFGCPNGKLYGGMTLCIPKWRSVKVSFPEDVLNHYSVYYNGKDVSDRISDSTLAIDGVSSDGKLEVIEGSGVESVDGTSFSVAIEGSDLVVESPGIVRIFNSLGVQVYEGLAGRISGLPSGALIVVSGCNSASVFIR